MSSPLYFLSDLHFHIDPTDQDREKIRRLRPLFHRIIQEEAILYIVGDLFDFWYEYEYAIPRHHFELLALLHQLKGAGIEVHYLGGNHDFWIDTFFREDLGIIVHPDPVEFERDEKRFWICHGDGVLADDKGYHLLKKILRHPVAIKLFRWIHPDIGFRIARKVASTSRKYHDFDIERNRRLLIRVYNEYVQQQFSRGYDYVILGHLHHPHISANPNNQTFLNLGDWLYYYSFARYHEKSLNLYYLHEDLSVS
jgi:UDP-2,3-diacylglucosamine hydrolase